MSVIGDVGGTLAGGMGGGLLAHFWDALNKRNSGGGALSSGPPMTAESVKLLDPLKGSTGAYANTGQNSLAKALGTLTTQANTSAKASGRAQGPYTGQALGRANSVASQGINNSVSSVLGGASLKEAQALKEHARQMALAREIGSIAKPSTLQEVIGGLSGAATTAGGGAALYQALGKNNGNWNPTPNPTYGTATAPYPGYDPTKMAGYSPYDYLSNWGGR